MAATGSVGPTMAPSANAAAHGMPGTAACTATATATMVNSTSPIADMAIGRMFARRSRSEAKNAPL